MKIQATYSLEDNKLRLYPSERLPIDLYNRLKSVGFKYAPMQKIFVAPMWTPLRESICIELAGEIENEDMTLEQRAQERAERFENYAAKRAQDANNYADVADRLSEPFKDGQPILIGHHSQRKAEKLQERIQSTMKKAVKFYETSNYWADRSEGVLSNALNKSNVSTRINRIKGLEADLRRNEKQIDKAQKKIALLKSGKITDENKTKIFGLYEMSFRLRFTEDELKQYNISKKPDENGFISVYYLCLDETSTYPLNLIIERCIKVIESDTHCQEWAEHFKMRIQYEKEMLKKQGHEMPDFKAIGQEKRAKTCANPIINTLNAEVVCKYGSESKKLKVFSITKEQFKQLNVRDICGVWKAEGFRYRCSHAMWLEEFGYKIENREDFNLRHERIVLFIKDQKIVEVPKVG